MPTMTYAQALNEALREEMRLDPRVFLMGEDIGHHGGIFRVTKDLIDEFGADRVRDTPISESGFVGLGIGALIGTAIGWFFAAYVLEKEKHGKSETYNDQRTKD